MLFQWLTLFKVWIVFSFVLQKCLQGRHKPFKKIWNQLMPVIYSSQLDRMYEQIKEQYSSLVNRKKSSSSQDNSKPHTSIEIKEKYSSVSMFSATMQKYIFMLSLLFHLTLLLDECSCNYIHNYVILTFYNKN